MLSLPTPQVLIDRGRLLANLDRMQALVAASGKRLRPHAKTHKSPLIARWQIERGAIGVCCAKIGEAEVFVDQGITDIRLPYPVHPTNAARLLRLMDRADISIIVDHEDVARGWSDAMRAAGRRLDVLVKVDVGLHRCGIDPHGADAAGFVHRVAALPGLRLRGLLSHAGHAYGAGSEQDLARAAAAEADILRALAAQVRASGVEIDELSVGATPTARFSAREADLTELRPGTYAYYDRTQAALGACTLADCALTVLATVVSAPAKDRIVLDCGSKTLSSDQAKGFSQVRLKADATGAPEGHGTILTDLESTTADDGLVIERLSEEHAVVRVKGHTRLGPGDRVRVVPNHACVVSNLVDCVQLVDGLNLVETVPVAARGRIQ